jgi:hypothetical protein
MALKSSKKSTPEILLFTIILGVLFQTPSNGQIQWTQRNPGENLNAIVWGNGLLLAVGNQGRILSSVGDSVWTSVTSGVTANLYAVTWGNNQFVVAGDSGTILLSADGITFSRQTGIPKGISLNSVIWADTHYVAVGSSGFVATSKDGIVWKSRSFSSSMGLADIAWTGKRYVVVGAYLVSASIFSSEDCETWKETSLGTKDRLFCVSMTDSGLIALGTRDNGRKSVMYRSTDGLYWKADSLTTNNYLYSVCVAQGKIVAVGYPYSNSNNIGIIGPGGTVTWVSSGSTLNSIAWTGNRFAAVGIMGKIASSDDGTTWRDAFPGSATMSHLNGVAWADDKFIAVGDKGTIITSMDGFAWIREQSGTLTDLNSVVWTGSRYWVAGDSSMMLSSPDGKTWSMAAVDTSKKLSLFSPVWNGSYLTVIGNGHYLFKSSDGTRWDTMTVPSDYVSSLVWTGTCLAVATWSSGLYTSVDGTQWTGSNTLQTRRNIMRAMVWTGTQYVLTGGEGNAMGGNTGVVCSSADGQLWTMDTIGNKPLNSIAWNGGMLAAVGIEGAIYTSQNGQSWTARASKTDAFLYSVACNDRLFVAVGSGGTVLTSPVVPVATFPFDNNRAKASPRYAQHIQVLQRGSGHLMLLLDGFSEKEAVTVRVFNLSGNMRLAQVRPAAPAIELSSTPFACGQYFVKVTQTLSGRSAWCRFCLIR